MREKKKLLKTLLKSGFSPLEINKEGKLQGGFGVVDPNGNCRGNCDCPPANDVCPIKGIAKNVPNQMRISKRNHYETKKEKFEVSYGKRF